jgi:hypothetical protein
MLWTAFFAGTPIRRGQGKDAGSRLQVLQKPYDHDICNGKAFSGEQETIVGNFREIILDQLLRCCCDVQVQFACSVQVYAFPLPEPEHDELPYPVCV